MSLIVKSLGLSTNDILPALNINDPFCENASVSFKKFNVI